MVEGDLDEEDEGDLALGVVVGDLEEDLGVVGYLPGNNSSESLLGVLFPDVPLLC